MKAIKSNKENYLNRRQMKQIKGGTNEPTTTSNPPVVDDTVTDDLERDRGNGRPTKNN